MAENKQERKTFKWGDQEYLLDDLLKLHADQEQYYYNFARDKGQYDDNALAGLRSAIASRIQSVKDGKAFGADGVLDTDTVDNIQIQTQKKGLLKKAKYVDQDNTEWAKYYLNQLVKNLKPTTTKDGNAWDPKKHGFSAFFTGNGFSAKDIFEQYDLRDKDNPELPRSFAQRDEKLGKIAQQYVNMLESKKFDYTKNDNDYDDDQLETARNLAANYKSMSRDEKAAALRKMGADNQIIHAFTSDRWELGSNDEDTKRLKAEKELKQKTKEYNDDITSRYGTFSALPTQEAQLRAYLGKPGSNFYITADEALKWAENNKTIDLNSYEKRYNQNKWDTEAAQYILPIYQANGRLRETTIDGVKYVYDPNSMNRENNSFIAIDPITGKMTQRFIYDIDTEAAALRNKYLQPQGASKYHLEVSSNKEGGVLRMQTGGDFSATEWLNSVKGQDYEQRAASEGITVRELKERERKPFGDETTVNNAGWTGNDIVQLGTMFVDLTSMFADPLTGAAMGVGTSTVNFLNDIHRDGWQTHDLWNYAKNLGMDALGVIPIVGDTFGTLGKVKKGLVNLAPKIIGYLGMAQNVMNAPEIIDSFSKIIDDREMTTQDWQNVANGIQTIVSGTRIGKDAIRNARAKKAASANHQDKLQIEVTDKAGASKLLVLDGENAKAVRESDHSVDAVNKILKKIEGFQDYNVASESPTFGFSLKRPGRKVKNTQTGLEDTVYNPFSFSTDRAKISAYYDPVEYARAYTNRKKENSAGGEEPDPSSTLQWFSNRYFNTKNVSTDALGKQNLDQVLKAKQSEIDADIEAIKQRGKAYSDETTAKKAELEALQQEIRTAETNKAAEERRIASAESTHADQNRTIRNAQRWWKTHADTAEGKRAASIAKVINNTQKQIDVLSKKPSKTKAEKAELKRLKAELKVYKEDYKTLPELYKQKGPLALDQLKLQRAKTVGQKRSYKQKHQDLLDLLAGHNRTKGDLETRINTANPEIATLLNPSETTITFNGQEFKLKPSTTFTTESLQSLGIFKQGGPIDKNKINKFLSYAKR